jgi:hypothetical protein
LRPGQEDSGETAEPVLVGLSSREDPGNPLVLDGEAIDAAAQDPLAIEKLMKGMSAVQQAR